MPYAQDLLTRIYNVHWGGAEFVVATTEALFHVKSGGEIKQATIPLTRSYSFSGSSYVRIDDNQVFAVCGVEGGFVNIGQPPEQGGVIENLAFVLLSNDGVVWRRTFTSPQGVDAFPHGTPTDPDYYYPWNASANAVVRHDSAFYLSLFFSRFGISTSAGVINPNWREDQIFKSSDGQSWSKISASPVGTTSYDEGYRSVYPTTYCTDNVVCKDSRNQSVPDGIMHHDTDGATRMRPVKPPTVQYDNGIGNFGDESTQIVIEYFAPEPAVFNATIPGLSQVVCVTGSGNTWLAGGYVGEESGGIALSSDRGQTWELLGTLPSHVVSISGEFRA